KFPGHPALKHPPGTVNLMNRPKAFRLSELYLILAEAAANNNDATTANAALNTLRSNRIENYVEASYSGQNLINEIRAERTKELIGEGFRMSDLRRWNQGFSRDYSHPENPAIEDILVPTGALVVYQPGDYRYTWPIPSAEISVNPQLKGQQNPGY
ncbi:MAG: RagB/SusD family nutrient uptake outer membrane protein, partial [Muribaculaceae bacterium]|nr:RagB/SusD family nutrient uptake outer membrane protein [Muribaculaceae bacterium]